MSDTKKPSNIKVDIKDDVASGKYSNIVLVAHTPVEFIFDFGTHLPLRNGVHIDSRIIMGPEHAKRLLLALQDNVGKYERQFGPIPIERLPAGATIAPFGTPKGEA